MDISRRLCVLARLVEVLDLKRVLYLPLTPLEMLGVQKVKRQCKQGSGIISLEFFNILDRARFMETGMSMLMGIKIISRPIILALTARFRCRFTGLPGGWETQI